MPNSTLGNLTAATANTGGFFYGTQSNADRKFTLTAAGAAVLESTAGAGNLTLSGTIIAGSNMIATGSLASTGANVEVQSNAGLLRFGAAGDVVLARELANTLALRNGTNAQTFLVNGTYTDASNYLRGSLGATSTAVQLKAESAGTGAANINVEITPKGTGNINTTRGINIGGATGDAGTSAINGASFVNINVGGTNKFGCGGSSNTSYQQLIAQSGVMFRGITSQTPGANGDFVIETTSNTLLTFKYRGSDGTTRTATLALV